MPILSYVTSLVPAIESGAKRQTIRRPRRRPFAVDELLYHYADVYRPTQRLIGISLCTGVHEITIARRALTVDGVKRADIDAFAQNDGLSSWRELVEFFERDWSLPFTGVLITWQKMLTPAEIRAALVPSLARERSRTTA